MSTPDAWRYPVLTARGEAVERMARAMRNGKAWSSVFAPKAAEQLAEDALAALEAAAPALSSKPVDDTGEAGSSIKLPLEAAAPAPTSLQKMQTSAPAPDEMRDKVATLLREQIYLQHIGDDARVVGYEQAAAAILALLAAPTQGGGQSSGNTGELAEAVEIVTEWLAMAEAVPTQTHGVLRYPPISQGELDAIALLAAKEQGR